jgi:hypothetical protein
MNLMHIPKVAQPSVRSRGNCVCSFFPLLPKDYETFTDIVKLLDQHYIPTRYANAYYRGSAAEHYTKAQAEEALKYAEQIFEEMRKVEL